MARIGVFICWCGSNIAGTVDVDRLVEMLRRVPDVVHAENYMYMCSDPGQDRVKTGIREHRLDRVVVASCSPRMHETTFRRAAASVGLNPYLVEIANIREQCSWVHQGDKEAATRKAFHIIQATLEKVRRNAALEAIRVPLTKRALVVGAGIAGITAALELADAGFETLVVERLPEPGGNVRRLYKTFPFHEDARDILGPRVEALRNHPKVRLFTSSRVTAVEGYVGNFRVEIATEDSVPVEETVGAIVVATGYRLYPVERMGEYGAGEIPDVIDALRFEELLREAAEGGRPVARPSDGRPVRDVVFIQCSGSRDPENHKPYCSRVCCLYTNKQARLFRDLTPEGRAVVSFMDVRTDCKLTEEYCQRNIEEAGLVYVRGRVSRVWQEGDRLRLWTADTLTGEKIELDADLVVLAQAVEPAPGFEEVSSLMRAGVDQNGFFQESHIKLRPVESSTRGVYLAGAGQYPKDITDSVAQAMATASKIQSLFAAEELSQDPLVAAVDPDRCSACGLCVPICPYGAREVDRAVGHSRVNEALCQGCGACVAVCPNKACRLKNDSPEQVIGEIEVFTAGQPDG
ncbi:CoB--CoM heterodisulfide reductase iron-sulfur subunit A family protein [Deferrisoma camini]|uniref:CoB--CoM heterodisulfide reductase iron-sulfur subunit A family protein n=1 Tax=Deferrisoma camini TaxID=1035120 RepID=UPI00046D34EF|nr:CoB--CoM heterodisulfide reductase iron-sulfur subunit A family protein [Deferrisoma camini]